MQDKAKSKEQRAKSQVIALLTDFGSKDYFVGAMKGAILSVNPDASIIDITHEIERHNIASADFTLRSCYTDFPKKTIFIAVVDPGVGSDRRAILVETDDYFFIAPDNGLLSFIFNSADDFRAFEITKNDYLAGEISRTFHGRDIFAPAAAHLSKGVDAAHFGAEIHDFVRFNTINPTRRSNGDLEARIIHIDCFGNMITNLREQDLPEKFIIEVGDRHISKFQKHFSEAKMSEVFMIFGSAGYLEIVAYKDSAAEFLDIQINQKLTVRKLS